MTVKESYCHALDKGYMVLIPYYAACQPEKKRERMISCKSLHLGRSLLSPPPLRKIEWKCTANATYFEGQSNRADERICPDILFLKHVGSILRQSSNPVSGFSMMEQVRLCAVWSTLNWLFPEPHTGSEDCLRVPGCLDLSRMND